ncbi:putative type IV prepilin peptidase [Candidatus Cyrtobacter comes]|uniref:Type IV prepilin peptidase n=1 Tax=Candidatus Cyrtobacter comes TaxID=675776 RepID=A0ABU5L7V0_9RICK|nr:prepilin peptidase [Candidatus Cyrtobacter comes]MDZ5762199.1 putative type IV prepilin peptidase [Candidatus Cyrtobacter comes]
MAGNIGTTILYRIPRKISIFAFRNDENKPFCSKCHHPLKPFEILPIIGMLLNQGVCRYCGHKIPIAYFMLEILTGVSSMILYAFFDLTEPFFILLLFSCALILHAFTLEFYDQVYIEITIFILVLGLVMFTLLQGSILGTVNKGFAK